MSINIFIRTVKSLSTESKKSTKQKRQRMSALLSAGTAAASLKHSAALPHGAIRKLKFQDSPVKITT